MRVLACCTLWLVFAAAAPRAFHIVNWLLVGVVVWNVSITVKLVA